MKGLGRVVVAMSGGVDSSVAALLLKKAGYDVVGLSLRLYQCPSEGSHGCCTTADRRDAREVCKHIGIPHLVADATADFDRHVIEPFVENYLSGRTPSPCIACNQFVKFPFLLKYAEALGADFIATGHYACVERDEEGNVSLLRAKCPEKDQSYFLFSIGQEALRRLLLPVGHLQKSEVRRIARAHGLPVSEKPESQEVCFVPKEGYASLIEAKAPNRLPGRGRLLDLSGRELGTHPGFHHFTIGQRKGLGLSGGPRRYVVRIIPERNEVILGDVASLLGQDCNVASLSFLDSALHMALSSGQTMEALVQIRSRHKAAPALLTPLGPDRLKVSFLHPQSAITPGQAAVFYEGDRVLGGGYIV